MKSIIGLSMLFAILLATSANAVAGAYYDHPRKDGKEFDATTWEWNGTTSEPKENKWVANTLCRKFGHDYASGYSIGKGQSKGTWRFHRSGKVEWCDFCQWYIKELTCNRGRN